MNLFTSNFFLTYLFGFALFASILWFYYYIGLYAFDKRKPYKEYKGKIAAIIPCYNEDEQNLVDTINCVKNDKNIDYFVFVDDGSKNNTKEVFMKHLKKENYIICAKNGGKRNAQAEGIYHITRTYGKDYFDSFVMMDSDTIYEKNAIYYLSRRMAIDNMGAVTANVLVKNRKDNLLTRALSAMYWSSSNIWRQAPANYGYMQVTNGQLSIYKAEPVIDLLPKYLTQEFWGYKCTFSDDRWITQHLQTDYNLNIDYEKKAVAYTYVPTTINKCWKMFMRWKKGSLRETLLVSKYILKKPLLVLDCWWNHLVSLLQLSIRICIIVISISYPMVLLYYLGIMVIISLVYGLNMIIENPKEVPFRIIYSLFNEIIFGWIILFAIINIRKQGWQTRSIKLINK